MEKTYIVEWAERKTTSTGKEKLDCSLLDCSLKDELGVATQNVTIWGDFPNFNEIMPGSKVTGTLTPAKDPKYGPTLYAPKPQKQGGVYKSQVIEKAMDKKEASIAKFQDQKEESIRLMSAQRDAVLIVTTLLAGHPQLSTLNEDYIKGEIVKWRDWFLSHKFNETLPF